MIQSLKKKLTLDSKNDMSNLVNFNVSSSKSENLHFDVLLLSIAYKVSAKKVQKNYLSWHWIKRSKLWRKTDFLFEKWYGEIWWTLTRAAESLKICTLMGYFCRNYVVFEMKKNTEELCREKWYNDVGNLVNFHTNSWKLNTLYIMF